MSISAPTSLSRSTRRFFDSVKDIFNLSKSTSASAISSPGLAQADLVISYSPSSYSLGNLYLRTSPQCETPLLSVLGNRHKLRRKSFYYSVSEQAALQSASSPTGSIRLQQDLLTYPPNRFENLVSRSSSQNLQRRRHLQQSPLSVLIPRASNSSTPIQHDEAKKLHRKSSWTHPFPSPTPDMQRRKSLIRERLFDSSNKESNDGSIHLQAAEGRIFLQRQYAVPTRLEDVQWKKAKTRLVAQVGMKQVRSSVDVEIAGQLDVSIADGKCESGCSSRICGLSNVEDGIKSDDGGNHEGNIKSTDSEVAGFVEEYYAHITTSSESGNALSSSHIPRTLDEVDEDQSGPETDYDSDEYFFRMLALLEQDITRHGISILHSRFFRKALKVNSVDPKCASDGDFMTIRENIWGLSM